ncbi:ribosome-inactivating protein gelonin-like [Humulus lupulus]|uniref:ribosome-inactivating protein gelonin-like n=1 Tax=Humulus lupulus TaxID=3486 RepID=UPI002B407CF0|nr:ribosome-inactivating protein gelonin-like [Humulus lupulus]
MEAISYNTVSLNTKDVSVGSYQMFMGSLRRELYGGTESHDIPVLRTKSAAVGDKQFVYVNLHNSSVSITFAVLTLNAYVVAYQVDGEEKRCYFFKEAPPNSKTLLFDQSPKTKKVDVELETNYNSLGMKLREETNLGFKPLNESLQKFKSFDNNKPTKDLRESLLIVIQMVSEAARFKYIQQKLEFHGFQSEFPPKGDIISYENNWSALSIAIQKSKDGKFPNTITLQNEDYSQRKVSTVAEVKADMKLLLNVATATAMAEL